MRTIIWLFVFSFMLTNLEITNAQSEQKFGLGVLAGGSKLAGDIENTNTAFTGGFLMRWTPIPFFAITAKATYGRMTSGLNEFKTSVFNTRLSGTIFLFPESRYRPFVNFGLSTSIIWRAMAIIIRLFQRTYWFSALF